MKTTDKSDDITERLRFCLPLARREVLDDQRLSDLGLDSLDTVEFLCTVHAEFGVRLREEDYHEGQTLRELGIAICNRRENI